MNNLNSLIEVKNICKTYPDFSLDNVSFNVPRGFIMGFIGPNGNYRLVVQAITKK